MDPIRNYRELQLTIRSQLICDRPKYEQCDTFTDCNIKCDGPRTGAIELRSDIRQGTLYCSLLNFACLSRNKTQSRRTLSHPFGRIGAAGQ